MAGKCDTKQSTIEPAILQFNWYHDDQQISITYDYLVMCYGTMMVVDMCMLEIAWGVMLDSYRGQSIVGPSDWGGH